MREQLLRINNQVTGHRLLRGAIHPGAATLRALPDPAVLSGIADDVAEIVALALAHSVVRDRFTGTAVLTTAQAADIGTLGYVARASGVRLDAVDVPSRTRRPERGGRPRSMRSRAAAIGPTAATGRR